MLPPMSLFEELSGLAVRRLSRKRLLTLRAAYLGMRRRTGPMMRAIYGEFGPEQLRRHLEERVGTEFEILMVHSSINNMHPTYTGGALDLLKMLVEFCGPTRTLAMPAFYFGDPEGPGLREMFAKQPRFDLRRTPSQMGIVTELFRRWRGVVQSRHPIYRVSALGPLAAALTGGHELATTQTGPGTPFDFMANHDTLIVSIGKPVEVLTQVHHVEDLLGDRFPVPSRDVEPLPMTIVDGSQEIPFVLRGRTMLWNRNMWKLRDIISPDILREWQFHRVPLFATRARDVTRCLQEAAGRGVTIYDEPASPGR
jgi:aminoglycoside 3-N-acetyltransferase